MKTNKKVVFVEWVPTGFKVGLNETPAAQVEDDELAAFERNVVMIGNNTAVSRVFSERISKKYDMSTRRGPSCIGTSAREWKRASSQRPERTWASSKRTISTYSRIRPPTTTTLQSPIRRTLADHATRHPPLSNAPVSPHCLLL